MAGWMSREAFERGEPCPSCGRPVLSDLPTVYQFDIDVLRGRRDDPHRLQDLRQRGLIKVTRPTDLGRRTLKRHNDDEQWLAKHRATPEHLSSASWTIGDGSGNIGPVHCMECCFPPPPSEEQIRRVAALLGKGVSTGAGVRTGRSVSD